MNNGAVLPAILFTGRFGSGKTETAINYARALVQGSAPGIDFEPTDGQPGGLSEVVVLVDLDIVTPYFRSREMAARMAEQGVRVVAPSIVGQHLDTPAITPQILGAVQQTNHAVVLDVGGDKQGARALGQFSHAIRRRGYLMHFVINPFRPFTNSVQGVAKSITEIEEGARLQVTSLISNPNLIGETTAQQILEGHARIESFARELELPIAFVCIARQWADRLSQEDFGQPLLILDRYFVQPWE
jgi:DNA polymerase III delta prime subunit